LFNQKNKPISKQGLIKYFLYDADKDIFFTKVNKTKTKITKPILIQIPLNSNNEKLITHGDYFYFNKQLLIKSKPQLLENEITIFWDKSLSQKNKKTATEIDFLGAYFSKVKNCKVNLVVFNTEVRETSCFLVSNGKWNVLKGKLQSVIYDGASSFDFLSTFKMESKLNFLFTDGLNT
jgi:hypothetical protein